MRKNFGSKLAIVLLWGLLALSLGSAVWYGTTGGHTLSLFETRLFGTDLSLALRIDALSSTIFCMVSLLAAIIGQYALRYLDGESRQWYFYRHLLLTVAAVTLLILSSNLLMFFAAWLGMSWGLHRLLLYYEERPAAVLAARKKLLVSRIGDLALLLAIGLLYRAFGTFEFHDLFELADRGISTMTAQQVNLLNWAGVFLAAGAMTKSAQFPFHFWLPETMETPTPVSALMHAGIINAGGFLVIRLSPIFEHAVGAGMLLTVAGALTAVYAALVMTTQNSIKRKLAFSTVSQMGMMMFACGIGAYSLALFHILAHSFYKAHAFLSTGSLVSERTRLSYPVRPWSWPMALLFSAACGSLLVLGLRLESGIYLPALTYAAVLILGLVQNLNVPRKIDAFGGQLLPIAGILSLLSIAVYLAFEQGLGRYVAAELASPEVVLQWYDPVFLVNALGFGIFALGFCLSNVLLAQRSPWAEKLYVMLWNGSYFGQWSTRTLLRLWPV